VSAIALGFWSVYKNPLFVGEQPERISALLTDPRWPWQPQLTRPDQCPGQDLYSWKSGKIPSARLSEEIRAIIASEVTAGVILALSRKDSLNHCWIHLKTGRPSILHEGVEAPLVGLGLCRTENLPKGKSVEAWLEVVHELVATTQSANAVIWIDDDERRILSRQYGTGVRQPKRSEDYPPNENVRVQLGRARLGVRYARPPGWGTYLNSIHVAAIGGRERIREVVQPPVMRDVGELLYLQLSESVADALSSEVTTKRHALTTLMEPLALPRAPVAL
jgi:hypothetical protein